MSDEPLDAGPGPGTLTRTFSPSDSLPIQQRSRSSEFRLLRIDENDSTTLSCHLHRYNVHHAPPYRALSYTWKNAIEIPGADDLEEDILVNGEAVSVGKNLATALKALRDWYSEDGVEFLWADASSKWYPHDIYIIATTLTIERVSN